MVIKLEPVTVSIIYSCLHHPDLFLHFGLCWITPAMDEEFKVCSYSKTTFICMCVCIKWFFFSLFLQPQCSTLEAVVLLTNVSALLQTKDSVTGGREASTFKLAQLPRAQLHCRWVDGVKLRKSSSIHYSTQPRFIFLPFSFEESRKKSRHVVLQ